MTPIIQIVYNMIILVYLFPDKVNDFIISGQGIATKMLNNARYAAQAAKVAELEDALEDLYDEQSLCSSKPRVGGNIVTRDAYLRTVKIILKELGVEVQKLADADIPNAQAIITDAGFAVKKSGGGHPQKNTVEDGTEAGSIVCTGAGQGARNWRISLDNVVFVIKLASKTTVAIFYGYASGTLLYVQNCEVLENAQEGTWSQSVKHRVK
jgi:hypothetical protein